MSQERFQDALWYKKNVKIVVGGSGGIGSWLSFFLTRAGFYVTTLDYDRVEEHNLSGQLFLSSDIGELKVKALENVISLFNDSDFNYVGINYKITESNLHYSFTERCGLKIIVSAFDNMKARTDLFNIASQIQNTQHNTWFIDGRLLMEQMRIYCINMDNSAKINDYITNHLFDDSEVEELPCTMKQVTHGAAMIATHMTGFITNIVANKFTWEEEVFKVPYIWDYIIPMNKITEQYEA